jgi:cation transporter-like permease
MPRIASQAQRIDRRPVFDVASDAAQLQATRNAIALSLAHYDRQVAESVATSRRAAVLAATAVVAAITSVIGSCVIAATVYAEPALIGVAAVVGAVCFAATWAFVPRYLGD